MDMFQDLGLSADQLAILIKAVFIMLMEDNLLFSTDRLAALICITAVCMGMGLDLWQRTAEFSGLIVTVGVMGMYNKIRISADQLTVFISAVICMFMDLQTLWGAYQFPAGRSLLSFIHLAGIGRQNIDRAEHH